MCAQEQKQIHINASRRQECLLLFDRLTAEVVHKSARECRSLLLLFGEYVYVCGCYGELKFDTGSNIYRLLTVFWFFLNIDANSVGECLYVCMYFLQNVLGFKSSTVGNKLQVSFVSQKNPH